MENTTPEWAKDLENKLPKDLKNEINSPGGNLRIFNFIDDEYTLEELAIKGKDGYRLLELIGIYYRNQQRWFDAVSLYLKMYSEFCSYQQEFNTRIHKGMPLCWLADCYSFLGYKTLGKRFIMLTLIEDGITKGGPIDPTKTGSYFRALWQYGLSHDQIMEYSEKAYGIYTKHAKESCYPEYVLQSLDQNWNVEIPSPNESTYYVSNKSYINYLTSKSGESQGKALEILASYIISCIPGCRTYLRVKSISSEYDVVCSLQTPNVDFRSELGRYFVVECKDWTEPLGFTQFAKFCRVLDSLKITFGILFSKNGISGSGKNKYSEREQLKVFQDRGMVIIVIDKKDIKKIEEGQNFIAILREKYEQIRLDLPR